MAQIKFGTDGWRAIIAEDFTFKNVERVAQATADYWKANPVEGTQKQVVVGYDRRFLSDQFARTTAQIMEANGFQTLLTSQPTPTPAVSCTPMCRPPTFCSPTTAARSSPTSGSPGRRLDC